jgi:hypothetical protein
MSYSKNKLRDTKMQSDVSTEQHHLLTEAQSAISNRLKIFKQQDYQDAKNFCDSPVDPKNIKKNSKFFELKAELETLKSFQAEMNDVIREGACNMAILIIFDIVKKCYFIE